MSFFIGNNIEVKPLSDTSYIDLNNFFQTQVGDFLQYSGYYLREYGIAKDSLLGDGAKYLFFGSPPFVRPSYQIDTIYSVVLDPTIEPFLIFRVSDIVYNIK